MSGIKKVFLLQCDVLPHPEYSELSSVGSERSALHWAFQEMMVGVL